MSLPTVAPTEPLLILKRIVASFLDLSLFFLRPHVGPLRLAMSLQRVSYQQSYVLLDG